jgi:hypothetical protein
MKKPRCSSSQKHLPSKNGVFVPKSNRIANAIRVLKSIKNPKNLFELKYGNMTAQEAGSQFFKLLIIRLSHTDKFRADATADCSTVISLIHYYLGDTAQCFYDYGTDFNQLRSAHGTAECSLAFRENAADLEARIATLREVSREYELQAIGHQLTRDQLYLKYAPYLQELGQLTPQSLVDDYFSKRKTPLDGMLTFASMF